MKKRDPNSLKIQGVGLDFTFNALRNVHRVGWQSDAPFFREISDGLSWFAYCKLRGCKAYRQLFVVTRGYGVFKMSREIKENISCPACKEKEFELRNVGFVNSEWALKGKLVGKAESRVFGEG